jgi:hypothetical protein
VIAGGELPARADRYILLAPDDGDAELAIDLEATLRLGRRISRFEASLSLACNHVANADVDDAPGIGLHRLTYHGGLHAWRA